MTRAASPLLIAVFLLSVACDPATSPDLPAAALEGVRQAEDARGLEAPGMTPIEVGISFPHPVVRHAAVRALGRLERADLIPILLPALSDSSQTIRVEAVNAVGQAALNGGAALAFNTLRTHLDSERDPVVRGVYGQTLGRLSYPDAEMQGAAERLMVDLLAEPAPTPAAGAARTLALTRGFESLARIGQTVQPLDGDTRALLAELTLYGLDASGADGPAAPRIRRTALMAYVAAGPAPDGSVIEQAMRDPDSEVRRIAARGLAALPWSADRISLALADPAPRVRWEALRVMGAQRQRLGCVAIFDAAKDNDGHVRLLALDLLAEPCPEGVSQRALLTEVAAGESAEHQWHDRAHATLSLSRVAPAEAGAVVEVLAQSPNPFVRTYAARAASNIGDGQVLSLLAADEHHNVRQQAIRGLFDLEGHAIDALLIAQLTSNDSQLIMTASSLLEGSPARVEVLDALFAALDRLTAMRRETSRDGRVALLDGIAALGDVGHADAVAGYLSDFDSVVAWRAAEVLSVWNERTVSPTPSSLPRGPIPSTQDLERLRRTTVILDMGAGREISIRLFPGIAPSNAARFERLARSGYFDGLTFHRVAPNFVVQGGSPGANEFWGDGPFTRDEVGLLGNWRGTVGLSTRGRDTGDGQLYINVVDNPRLDHNYTIFAEVVGGMDTVDELQEGAFIVSARVVEDSARP